MFCAVQSLRSLTTLEHLAKVSTMCAQYYIKWQLVYVFCQYISSICQPISINNNPFGMECFVCVYIMGSCEMIMTELVSKSGFGTYLIFTTRNSKWLNER